MKIQIFLFSVLAFEILNNFLVETILRVGWTHYGFPVSFPFVLLLFLPSSKAGYQIFPLKKISQHTLWYLHFSKITVLLLSDTFVKTKRKQINKKTCKVEIT